MSPRRPSSPTGIECSRVFLHKTYDSRRFLSETFGTHMIMRLKCILSTTMPLWLCVLPLLYFLGLVENETYCRNQSHFIHQPHLIALRPSWSARPLQSSSSGTIVSTRSHRRLNLCYHPELALTKHMPLVYSTRHLPKTCSPTKA